MVVFLIIVAIIVILVVRSNNKEKERQERQRIIDADTLRTKYSAGYAEWEHKKYPHAHLAVYSANLGYTESDLEDLLSHKQEIINLHNEIIAKRKAAAKKDEEFEKEQKNYTDKCYNLSKTFLNGFGRYYYDVEWRKSKSDGSWSRCKYTVWQFFSDAVCLAKDLDYSYRTYEKTNADNIPLFRSMTRQFPQSDYDKINEFLSAIAKLSNSPLIVVLVNSKIDYKNKWSQKSIDYHLKPINREIENAIVIPITELDKIDSTDNGIKHVVVIDVYTQNDQIKGICNSIDYHFKPSHAAITYISLLKCYDKDEMAEIIKKSEEEEKRRDLHLAAYMIKSLNPDGYNIWLSSLSKNDSEKTDITNQMIIDAENTIMDYQSQFEKEEKSVIEKVRNAVKPWEHLTSGFAYTYLLRYYPTTCEFDASDEEWDDRYKVWNFKNDLGKVSEESHNVAISWVIEKTKETLEKSFGKETLKYITLVCIPASTKVATERRYKVFAERLCNETGMINAYTHIKVIKDSTPKNKGGEGKPEIEYDSLFFMSKNIILFDDVITKGNSMLRMKNKMEELGASVIGGLSIGKTVHNRPHTNTSTSSEYSVDDLPF